MSSAARTLVALGAAVAILAATACGTSGRDLRDPPDGYAAPAPTPTSTDVAAPVAGFTVSSPAFAPGAPLPERFTCEGEGVSPPLSWTSLPDDTVEVAVVVSDPASDFFIHWIVTGISPAVSRIDEGSVPAGATEGPNTDGGVGWAAPCPDEDDTDLYDFTVYAYAETPQLEADMSALETVAQLDDATSQRTVMTASASGA